MATKKNMASAAKEGTAPSATPPATGDIQSLLAGPLPLTCILLLALALRAWGITWGLPSATHFFSYHTDETVILGHSWYGMSLAKGHLLPGFYDYPSLQLYLILLANTMAHPSLSDHDTPYFVGRMLSLAMGVGTVWATFALGAKLWGRTCGLLAALLLALMPLHAQHSHFMTVDVPGTFWVVLSLLYAAKMTDDPRPWRAALVAGVFVGLAAATKYNLALVLLPALLVALVAKRAKLLVATVSAAALSFLGTCPGFLLQHGQFVQDFEAEAVHVRNVHDPTFAGTGNGFLFHLMHNLDPGLGFALLVLSLVSLVFAVMHHERSDGLLAAFALPYSLLIGLAAVRYARYTIPLLPVLALWSARLVAECVNSKSVAVKTSARFLAAIICGATLVNCVVLIRPMAGVDTRDQAAALLNAKPTATVAFGAQPWFDAPPIDPYFTAPGYGIKGWAEPKIRAVTPPQILGRIVYSGADWDVGLLESRKPDYVVLTEYEYTDPLRVGSPAALAYLKALDTSYRCVAVFDTPSPALTGSVVDGLPERHLPHDMRYPSPIILVYARK